MRRSIGAEVCNQVSVKTREIVAHQRTVQYFLPIVRSKRRVETAMKSNGHILQDSITRYQQGTEPHHQYGMGYLKIFGCPCWLRWVLLVLRLRRVS